MNTTIKNVTFKVLKVGHCNHPQCVAARGTGFKSVEFPALCVLIKHPEKGYVLYDTGYENYFFEETKYFPNKLYAIVTPVYLKEEECLGNQLKGLGLTFEDVGHVIVSHFHADHIAGIKNFKSSQFICFPDDLKKYKKMNSFKQLTKAFLNGLIPKDFESRMIDVNKLKKSDFELQGFPEIYDIFEDNSLLAVPLAGHTEKQLGLIFEENNQKYFLVADAIWGVDYLRNNQRPSSITRLLVDSKKNFDDTFDKLRNILLSRKEIKMIPSHCSKTYQELKNK